MSPNDKVMSENEDLGILTCPVIFKAVEEMEDHHYQSMERDECNVHLGIKKKIIKKSSLNEAHAS